MHLLFQVSISFIFKTNLLVFILKCFIGVVSTVVSDSPFKIFIGGLPNYLNDDQVCFQINFIKNNFINNLAFQKLNIIIFVNIINLIQKTIGLGPVSWMTTAYQELICLDFELFIFFKFQYPLPSLGLTITSHAYLF